MVWGMAKFSDKYISGLKPKAKEYRVTEGNGFVLRVLPSGTKVWTYRYRQGERDVMLALGRYPALSLADARKSHADAMHLRERGGDPATAKKEARREKVESVGDLAEKYLAEWAKPRKRSWKEDERTINADILPAFRSTPLAELRRRDIVAHFRAKAKTAPNQAWQALKIMRRMLNYALEEDLPGLEANPCAHIKLTAPEPKSRTLSRDEIKLFWQATDVDGIAQTAQALRMVLLTGQRPGEVIGMHRREIDGQWWTIPAARSKNGRPNRVFLTKTALQLISGMDGFIFPGEVAKGKPARARHENAMCHYLRRLILRSKPDKRVKGFAGRKKHEAARKAGGERPAPLPVPYFTPHDLRRTAATRIAEIGIQPHTIARILNHIDRSVTALHYNLYNYDAEKKEAMEAWEKVLLEIVEK